MTLTKALKETTETKWKHAAGQIQAVDQMRYVIGELGNPATVTQRVIDEAILTIQRRWPNPSTAKRVATNFRAMVRVGQRYGLLPAELRVDMPKAQIRRRIPLTPGQLDEVKAAVAGTEHELPTLLLIHCGLRGYGEELRRLRYEDVDHVNQTITVRSRKGGLDHERTVPLPHHLYSMIPSVGEGFLCPREQVDRAAIFFRKNFRGLKPYQIRHSYATRLLSAGVPVTTVQYLMGHSSVETTMIYTHVTADDISSARQYA